MATQTDEPTYQDYRKTVEYIADEVEQYARSEGLDYDDVHDYVYEAVDASRWVFQYNRAMDTVKLSDSNPDGLWETADSFWEAVTFAAFECMKQDVLDHLRRTTDILDQ